jgi:hypothetical protein
MLTGPERPKADVDLHPALPDLPGRSLGEVFARTVVVSLDGVTIRTLGPEDHLRLLIVHLMKHGAWRPTWLVDVALSLECVRPDFDWTYFLDGEARTSGWLLGILGLAEKALGADLGRMPDPERARRLPSWLYPSLIRQWGHRHYMQGIAMDEAWRSRSGVFRTAWARWPNPIQATAEMRAAFNEAPRLPYQTGEYLRRSLKFFFT